MILIGSEAAKRAGCLPAWRDPLTVNDYDLIGTEEELHALVEHLKPYGDHTRLAEWFENRWTIWLFEEARRIITVDYVIEHDAYEPWSRTPLIDGKVFGLDVKVAGFEALHIVKEAYAGRGRWVEKNDKDLAWFRAEFIRRGSSFTNAHRDLYAATKAKHDRT